jgi:hypothetical protein
MPGLISISVRRLAAELHDMLAHFVKKWQQLKIAMMLDEILPIGSTLDPNTVFAAHAIPFLDRMADVLDGIGDVEDLRKRRRDAHLILQ